RWLEWHWRAAPGAAPTFLSVGLNPAREDFYDYECAAWYDTPRRSRSRTLVGPHVDHGATRQHLVTPCVPVVTESDDFLGVAAADLRVRELEPLVLQAMRHLDAEAALVNADGRVVASNTPRWLSGSLLRARTAGPLVTPATPEWSDHDGFTV